MGIGRRLRSLDDRVLGRPEPRSSRTSRSIVLLSLVGSLAVLVLATVTGESSYVAGIGGFVGFLLVSAVQWRVSTRAQRRAASGG